LIFSQMARRFEEPGGRVRKLVTDAEEVDCDIALVSIGVRPETSLAAQAGLALGPTRAIAVNERLQTSDPALYAGGDCVECRHLVTGKPAFVPLGSTANKHGRVIGTNVAGGNDTFAGIVGTAVAKVFDVAVGRTGLSEREAGQAGFNVVTSASVPDQALNTTGCEARHAEARRRRRERQGAGPSASAWARSRKENRRRRHALSARMDVKARSRTWTLPTRLLSVPRWTQYTTPPT
jgi:pyruvate/2-oxoglutarate dehydrogenase complex dihydrolipoamide dehydrogenase (E3) component